MDDMEQAQAYSDADFTESHQRFVDEFVARFPAWQNRPFRAIDLGCGPADVTVRFAQAHPQARVDGVDAADAMLAFGRRRLHDAGLDQRVRLELRHLPDDALDDAAYDVGMSNSVLHHLADPAALWHTLSSATVDGASILVMDLCRPATTTRSTRWSSSTCLTRRRCWRATFAASLRAAYRVDEVRRAGRGGRARARCRADHRSPSRRVGCRVSDDGAFDLRRRPLDARRPDRVGQGRSPVRARGPRRQTRVAPATAAPTARRGRPSARRAAARGDRPGARGSASRARRHRRGAPPSGPRARRLGGRPPSGRHPAHRSDRVRSPPPPPKPPTAKRSLGRRIARIALVVLVALQRARRRAVLLRLVAVQPHRTGRRAPARCSAGGAQGHQLPDRRLGLARRASPTTHPNSARSSARP